jgi:hypothetical protein
MHAIGKKYMCNHMHNVTLLQFILKELAGADSIRVLKEAPALGTGTAQTVTESVSYLRVMMGEDTGSAYTESAYGVSSDSSSSEEKCKPRAGKHKESQQLSKLCGGRRKQKNDKDNKQKKNT